MTTLEGLSSSHSSSPNLYACIRFAQATANTTSTINATAARSKPSPPIQHQPHHNKQQQQQQKPLSATLQLRQRQLSGSVAQFQSSSSASRHPAQAHSEVPPRALLAGLPDRKRQLDVQNQVQIYPTTHSYPSSSPPHHNLIGMSGQASHAISPSRGRALPSFHDLRGDEEEEAAMINRRRLDTAREEADYHHREVRRADEYDRLPNSVAERTPSNAPSASSALSDRRSMGDEAYDASVPLARRRGDAAQAKASRLHIDTGYGTDAGSSHSGGNAGAANAGESGEGVRSAEHASRMHSSSHSPHNHLSSHGVKSAPPYKATFFDRENSGGSGAAQRASGHYDHRAPGPELPALSSSRGASGPGQTPYYSSASGRYNRQDAAEVPSHEPYDGHDHAGTTRREGMPLSAAMSSNASYRASHVFKGGAPAGNVAAGAGTPLTGSRMGFVPQTATLPSPAYHTTHFFRNGNGGGAGASSSAQGISFNGTSGGGQSQQQPRTAGLNPPMTARLPEHLRSPPSSKTQFLSLFSNFYDSLQDSRTLKATLEDQVRRSNTLLQTLQRSARVLELTVERRLTAERSQWEAKVQALEQRCRRLERATGAGSPTPAPADVTEYDGGHAAATGNALPNKPDAAGAIEKASTAPDEEMDNGEAVHTDKSKASNGSGNKET